LKINREPKKLGKITSRLGQLGLLTEMLNYPDKEELKSITLACLKHPKYNKHHKITCPAQKSMAHTPPNRAKQ
jgi:hypothetical protein